MKLVSLFVTGLALHAGFPISAASAAPALTLDGDARTRAGAFAGARFRMVVGGKEAGRARVGLAVAPLRQQRWTDGRETTRLGEALELGFASGEPIAARFAGARLAGGPELGKADPRLGVSTIGYAGIAAGVIVAGFVVLALVGRGDKDN